MGLNIDCILNGVHYREPIEWRGLQVLASFDNSAVQANISLENVTFVNEAAKAIRDYVLDVQGNGIFQALPVTLVISDGVNTIPNLDYYIDFTQEFKIINPVKVSCKLVKRNGLNDLETRISALTFGYLRTQNINTGDFTEVKTRVVPFDQTNQLAQMAMFEFVLVKEAAELIRSIQKDINTITSLVATGGLTSPAAGLKEAIADLLIQLIYLGIIIIQLYKLTKKFITLFFGVPSKQKGMTYHRMLQRTFQHLGYGFNTSIPELSTYVYLPSNPDENGITKGIPQSHDYGYRCSEFVNLVLRMFCARMVIVNGNVELHPINSNFFRKRAVWTLPDVLDETVQFNTDEFRSSRLISFQTDISDEYTVKNFTGTNFEIVTTPIKKGDIRLQLNKGFEEVNFPVALGNVKNNLTDVESALIDIVQAIDKLLQKMGSRMLLANTLPVRTGTLVVSGTTWSVPKIIALGKNGQPMANQRAGVSARYLWDKYWNVTSFLPSNPYGQKQLFKDKKIPFGLSDFLKLINNSYFATGKVEAIKWAFDADTALIDYWEGRVYTNNLQEQKIEP